ncbi:amino acid ABC transporter permease [Bradyrhizobium niftali]|jgi:polar amino acid transport system permease protein|uniref:Amino acid ABC transporter permease n=1 Tax=Bradyrhizobium niftali TaxID=2560055 RepID=A0A4Y9M839_9BRAD|nr:amino acid ABC transporter permease [Bradyrhizobium niftali]TFV51396.1 amino acid ABC transporter permease [Bradyrhizobium niftali]
MGTFLETYGGLFAAAFATTLTLTAAGLVVAALVALPLALGLRSQSWLIAVPARLYVELMRGAPLVILLFLAYYGGPSFGIVLDAETAGIAGLGLYGAGYFAEIYRAGLNAVPRGEIEAAAVLGLSRGQIFLHVRIPRAARLVLPPAIGQAINLLKESAVLSVITVPELTKVAGEVSNLTFSAIAPYLTAALLYWIAVEALARAGDAAERHLAVGKS